MADARVPLTPEERAAPLDARRHAKMATSAHAFVRGSTESFYAWLSASRRRKLPDAPAIWVGGDCHVGNLGPHADVEGEVHIEVRDLDQTVIGSPAHDVLRLALSMAMAVRASDLPGAVTAQLVAAIAASYERVLEMRAARREMELPPAPSALASLVREASKRSRRTLFEERLGRGEALFPIGKRYWPLTADELADVRRFFETERARKLATVLTKRPDDAQVRLLDAAFWVKGCSSLGLWRCAAIVEVGRDEGEGVLALMDIKEARTSHAPRARGAKMPRHQGERVMTGARHLAPGLGERMVAARVAGRDVFVRELLPQDLKFELASLKEEEAIEVGGYLAAVVALAHGRQMTPEVCAEWVAAFRKTPAKNLEAPAWLWAGMVELVGLHESAYLEHCRTYALSPPVSEMSRAPGLTHRAVSGD